MSDWTVFDAVPDDWTPFVADLLKWKQGDLLLDVPYSWIAPPGLDPVTGSTISESAIGPWNGGPPTTGPAIVCSQTCDIAGTQIGAKHPFILLAPLIRADLVSPADRKLASLGRIGYLFPVNDPHGGSDAWFADLRLVFAGSKALLQGREPIPGTPTQADSFTFSVRMGMKFARPALHAALSEELPRALSLHIQGNAPGKPPFSLTEEVRLLILGDWLQPTRVSLLILQLMEMDTDEQEVWRSFDPKAASIIRKSGAFPGPMVFVLPGETKMSIATYRSSVPLQVNELPARWP